MKIKEWLSENTRKLEDAGIATARLDCTVLLEDLIRKDRSWLLAHPEFELNKKEVEQLERQLKRRMSHEPLAYLRGKSEFYGREFIINKHVLEPRPESETVIDLLKSLKIKQPFNLVDVGAGSGALGITAKLELPNITVEMLELDDEAIKICEKNKQHFNVDVSIKNSDLLGSATKPYDVILANLPYVPDNYHVNQAAAMEPSIAIFGGPDGLDLYRRLFGQIAKNSMFPRYVLTESLPFQQVELVKIAQLTDYELLKTDDFIQVFIR